MPDGERRKNMAMPPAKNNFDVKAFLANIGQGRKIVRVRKKNRVDECSSQSLASDFGARKTGTGGSFGF